MELLVNNHSRCEGQFPLCLAPSVTDFVPSTADKTISPRKEGTMQKRRTFGETKMYAAREEATT